MPFGENGEHVTVKLIDFDDLEQNQYVVTQQYTFRAGKTEKRADLVLLINGMPLVLIEAKTPVRPSQSWLDGAASTMLRVRLSPVGVARSDLHESHRAQS